MYKPKQNLSYLLDKQNCHSIRGYTLLHRGLLVLGLEK